ncbi:MAG: hypothetical protein K2L45_06445 [Muribaculaceae bacterium]|nr:hypothetical protein [Muribaculaceae bacterium]
MRKSLLTFGVACLALSSFASTRILYQQNFETATSAEETGWSFGGASMSIASDAFGKYLELSLGQNNGRSGQVTWGQDIYLNEAGESILEDGTYNLKFDFCIKTTSNNQYNSEITVFTNHAPIANNKYRNPWSQSAENSWWQTYLFDMSQLEEANENPVYAINGATTELTGEDGAVTYGISFDETQTLSLGAWYTVELDVNTNTREVEYSVTSLEGEIVQAGTIEVPATNVNNGLDISMYAEGLFALLARYQTVYQFDNIMISFETSYEWANAPTIALTGMGQTEDEQSEPKARQYTITFLEEETLHVVGTDGQEIEVEWAECEGAYKYFTTTSGVLKAWTTVGEAKSEVVEENVECVAYVLPAADVTISSVKEGFGKTYTLTVSNADVPMRPTIFINYEFNGVNGEVVKAEEQASGCQLTVTEAGTLKVTTEAFGYEAKTIEVKNDLEFATKKVWDFARMTQEEISAAGFPAFEVLNSSATSGFNNWTARKRLYYSSATETVESVDEEGNPITVPATIYPFGFISEDNTTNVINYTVIDRAAIAETEKSQYFEGLTIFPDRGKVDEGGLPNVGMLYHIGLYNDQTKNNNNNIIVHDLDQNDFVVINYINNYGGNSNHPTCATDDEYYAQLAGEDAVYSVAETGVLNEETGLYDVTYALYRIDTACAKITVYKQNGDAVEAVEAVKAVDNNWYSIDGVRVAQPTRPGLYIHNGKKIIVK